MTGEDILKEIESDHDLGPVYRLARRQLAEVNSVEALKDLRIAILGRKGRLSTLLQGIGKLPPEERRRVGRLWNQLKAHLEAAIDEKIDRIRYRDMEDTLRGQAVDITLPGKDMRRGSLHIVSQVVEEIEDIFIGMGYRVVEGPEVELDYYNFEALNTPEWHPSKTLQDTFYVDNPYGTYQDVLLRTHTSPVQVRAMEITSPPLYVIAPGKAFRRDVPDATHSVMMHQVEGLAVDDDITLGDLKGTLEYFARRMFGEEREVRFRPHFFPFTEPSAEVDVSCHMCSGSGCRVCKGTGWLEILGSGIVDPNVFGYVGYDPEKVSGFAFGMGVERIAMLKYGIPDIRFLFDNDIRLLRQF
ncbi:MAG: phenylalanine--tRNA ligase subunit alpha [Actinomycetota bacterium]|nr:phenylalanine--tRNA ligase subunit alpha [Actinomycetota bacterium]